MSNLTTTGFTLLTFFTLLNASLIADEIKTVEKKTIEDQALKGNDETRINAQYFSADAIQAIPRLKALANQEPEYNKMIFQLEGYPKNKEIILEIRRLASTDAKRYEPKVSFFIQDDGWMLIKNSEQRLQRVIGSSRGFLPGERVFYRFRTSDGQIDKEISGIPTPAILRDKDHNIVLKAELVSIDPTVYRLFFPSMNEGEEYDLKSTSVGEIIKAKPRFTKSTPLHYSPAANGNSRGGEAILEIHRKSGQSYMIQLPWGTALEGYLSGEKVYSPKPRT